jgi:hypothetical protein
MSNPETLDEFCQIFIQALQAMKKANELPPYMTGKARDVNANNIHTHLSEKIQDESVLLSFLNASLKSKVCTLESLKTKAEILTLLEEYRPFLDRVRSGSYKLILDRFMAAHELALELSKMVDQILENESTKTKTLVNKAS